MPTTVRPTYFATPAKWRQWLARHHRTRDELLVGFYKKDTGLPSITWPESVDEALCFGWIDGIRRSLDATSYTIRFTPRRAGSNWSAVNVRRVEALKTLGRMKPAGLKAFAARRQSKSAIYSYEQTRKSATFPPKYLKTIKGNRKAWTFLQSQAPSYQRLMAWYVMSAKLDATQRKRLAKLIATSAAGRRLL